MIRHLLIAIALLAGCGDWYHCDDPNKPPGTQVCLTAPSNPDGCAGEGEGEKTYYVWLLVDGCAEQQEIFCAVDDASAQTYVDNTYGNTTHGAPSTDGYATAPKEVVVCGSNPADPSQCILGSSDESLATKFYVFSDDQIPLCEMALDPGCTTWAPVDSQPGNCPGMP